MFRHLVFIVCAMLTPGLHGQSENDEGRIRKTIENYVAAFNAKDAARLLNLLTEDEDGRNPLTGEFMPKRSLADLRQGFQKNPGIRWKHTIDRVRLLSADFAIVDTTAEDVRPQASGEKKVSRLITYVLKKQDGSWKIAAVRQSMFDSSTAAGAVKD